MIKAYHRSELVRILAWPRRLPINDLGFRRLVHEALRDTQVLYRHVKDATQYRVRESLLFSHGGTRFALCVGH
jgi:hypothetical protein